MATITSINISYSSTGSFVPITLPAQRTSVIDTTNRAYPRYATLASDSVRLVYYTASVVIPLSQLFSVAATALPTMTWAPIIVTQPTASVAVTHPASASFFVSASSEIPMTYVWYYTSASIGPIALSGSNSGSIYGSYTGSLTSALTCSTTSITTQKTASYYCIVSNAAGSTPTNTVYLYVN